MSTVGKLCGILIVILALFLSTVPDKAWGRAGGGGSSGSRGSRSYSSPSRSYSAPSRPSSPSSQPFTQPRPTPAPQPAPAPATGGLWRSLAGGVAGGILGGLLFRGLGFGGGYGGGFGGGFGLFDLILLAGIGYLIYRIVWRSRRTQEATATGYYAQAPLESSGYDRGPAAAVEEPPLYGPEDLARGLSHIRQMDPRFDEGGFKEWCSDTFFRIQAAWMHRDLEKLRPVLTEEMQEVFRKQVEDLKAKRQINKLENITVRSVEMTEAWQEQGQDYITVRFLANLLDYTVDEASGKVMSGSDSEPVKFEEFWTWVRPVGPNPWRLSAINQAK